MTHAAIYIKGSDEITYFIRDCVQTGRNFKGSNGSVTGVKESLFDVKWTDDLAEIGGSIKALSEAKRYKGQVISTQDDIDKITRAMIAEKYPVHEEIKILRLKLAGDETGWKEYQEYIDGLVNEGREFKNKMEVQNA